MRILLVCPLDPFHKEKEEPFILPEGMSRIAAYLKKHGFYVKQISLLAKYSPISMYPDMKALKETTRLAKHLNGKRDYEIECTISRLSDELKYNKFDVIGFSICTQEQLMVSILLAKYIRRKSNVKIIFGGPVFDWFEPRYVQPYINLVDYIIAGEGERSLLKLLNLLKNGSSVNKSEIGGLIYFKNGSIIQNKKDCLPIDCLPLPDYKDIIQDYKEASKRIGKDLVILYQISRGCINRCRFCNFSIGYNLSLRQPKLVVADILKLTRRWGVNRVVFGCTAINMNNKYLQKLCNSLIKAKSHLKWNSLAIPKNLNFSLLKLMKKSGCVSISYGIESGSPRILRYLGRNMDIKEIKKIIQDTKKLGIHVIASFIFSIPSEKKSDFIKTIEFIKKNQRCMDLVVLHRFHFSYGSPFYAKDKTFFKKVRLYFTCLRNKNVLKELSEIEQSSNIQVRIFGYIPSLSTLSKMVYRSIIP